MQIFPYTPKKKKKEKKKNIFHYYAVSFSSCAEAV